MGCSASAVVSVNRQNIVEVSSSPHQSGGLIMPKKCVYGLKITKEELQQVRNVFWSTQVSGSPMMWQALHSACEAILSKDIPLATALLEASNIKLAEGLSLCYDERGHAYKVPSYLYMTPVELVEGEATPPASAGAVDATGGTGNKKGNGKPLKIKVRIDPGDYNIVIDNITTTDTVQYLKQQVVTKTADGATKSADGRIIPTCEVQQQRVMYLGKELRNPDMLGACNVDNERIVQIFLRPVPQLQLR